MLTPLRVVLSFLLEVRVGAKSWNRAVLLFVIGKLIGL